MIIDLQLITNTTTSNTKKNFKAFFDLLCGNNLYLLEVYLVRSFQQ